MKTIIALFLLSSVCHAGIQTAQKNLEGCVRSQYSAQQTWNEDALYSADLDWPDNEDFEYRIGWARLNISNALRLADYVMNTEEFAQFKKEWNMYIARALDDNEFLKSKGYVADGYYWYELSKESCLVEINAYEKALLEVPSLNTKNKNRNKIKTFGGSLSSANK